MPPTYVASRPWSPVLHGPRNRCPEAVVATSRANFAAFVRGVKAGEFDHLIETPVQG
ncbi:hypothetical protein ACIRQY_14795 [Streptomyces sp. NPDC101490]|uniref:hypothetical protein n=1 Tax=Streptomyces sp. NPDC101490 TaxID=3366143 RepID=UPI0037F421C8